MLPRKESYWFEGLKFAEDEINIALLYDELCSSESFHSPEYALRSDKDKEEFYQGYYSCVDHYKNILGLIK